MVKATPMPPEALYTLAHRLESFGLAIAALSRVYDPTPNAPIPQSAEGVAYHALTDDYLKTRGIFETIRAQFEDDFMTWHIDVLARTDALYRGEPVPGTPAQVMPVGDAPTWAEAATPDSEA